MTWEYNDFDELLADAIGSIVSLAILLLLLGIGLRITTWIIQRAVRHRSKLLPSWEISSADDERSATIARVLTTAARAVFGLLAVVIVLSSLGVNLAAILASVSLISIALGFGAQYLVRDYLSGILLLTEDQYRVGDSVEINKISGTVEDVRLRLTVLRDGDGTVHHIPNGEIRIASNKSKEFAKINQLVTVGYGEDLKRVFEIINRIGADISDEPEWKESIRDPPYASRVQELGENGVVVKISGETTPRRNGAVQGELRLRILEAFESEGIEHPYPQRIVHQAANARTNGASTGGGSRSRSEKKRAATPER